MKVAFNILWVVIAGAWLAIAYVIAGVVMCFSVIGIPFGIQSFKLAGYALWPFGRVVIRRPHQDVALSLLGNVIWFVFAGIWLVLLHLVTGVFLMFTIIGIPLGVANIKMASLALSPFGKVIVPEHAIPRGAEVLSDFPEEPGTTDEAGTP